MNSALYIYIVFPYSNSRVRAGGNAMCLRISCKVFFWMQKQASTGAGFFPYFVLKVVKKVAYLPGPIFHAVA